MLITDRKLRTESLSSLQSFLSSRSSLPDADALRLWTGLYYALWMTDRPRPQQALASDLANLVFDLRAPCVVPFLRGFWAVLSKQWPHIDALRMDKFLLLVRRVFSAQVRWVRERKWKGKEVAGLLEVFKADCFDAEDENKVALGLRLHVLDLWVDELEQEKALEDDENSDRLAFVKSIGEIVEVLRRSPVKAVRQRANDSYDDERLPWGTKGSDDDDEDMDGDDDGWGGIED